MTLQDYFLDHIQLQNQWDFDKNPQKPDFFQPNSHVRAWWRCERGHQWQSRIDAAVEGNGCPYCAGRRAIPGETDLQTACPELMRQWDYEKNAGVHPSELLPSSHERVWWRCERGHCWQAVVFSRTKEKTAGCPYCAGRKVLPGFNDLATLKPKVAGEWYQALNAALRPEDVTLGSNKKVWWKCSDGHVWQAAIYSRTRKKGSGCPVCAQGTLKRTVIANQPAGWCGNPHPQGFPRGEAVAAVRR